MSASPSSTLSSSLAWTTAEDSEIAAEEELRIEDFVGFTELVTREEWWEALPHLPLQMRLHLSQTIQHITSLRRSRPAIAYRMVESAMEESWCYGVSLLIALFQARTATRAQILPCDTSIPRIGRSMVRLNVNRDSVKIFYFTKDGTVYKTCHWSYGHHKHY